jgi:hypothetical protein
MGRCASGTVTEKIEYSKFRNAKVKRKPHGVVFAGFLRDGKRSGFLPNGRRKEISFICRLKKTKLNMKVQGIFTRGKAMIKMHSTY